MNTLSFRVTNTQRQVGGGTTKAKNYARQLFGGKTKTSMDEYRRLAREAASGLILHPKEDDGLSTPVGSD